MIFYTISSPVGPLTLAEENGLLRQLLFGSGGTDAATPLLREAAAQLEAYFLGERRSFYLPLAPEGTAFQKRCWSALQQIPYGETRTYAQQAAAIGSPGACRAVGGANHRNPLPILIPCHRVIGAGGALTGYGGGLEIKRFLLAL